MRTTKVRTVIFLDSLILRLLPISIETCFKHFKVRRIENPACGHLRKLFMLHELIRLDSFNHFNVNLLAGLDM